MLDKLAQISAVRDSEVRGCLAAFVDSGIMKVASEEDFDALSSAVADNIGIDYDIDTIYKTAAYLLEGDDYYDYGYEKTAEEQHETACMAALGELLMMKTAGEISDWEFAENAEMLMKEAAYGDKNNLANRSKWQQRNIEMQNRVAEPTLEKIQRGKNRGKMGWAAPNVRSDFDRLTSTSRMGIEMDKARDAYRPTRESAARRQARINDRARKSTERDWQAAKEAFKKRQAAASAAAEGLGSRIAGHLSRNKLRYGGGALGAAGLAGAGILGTKLYNKYKD